MSRSALIIGVTLFLLSTGEVAHAQITELYKTPDSPGGNAGLALSNIRRRDIGTGFTAANINQQTLAQSSITSGGSGAYTLTTRVGGINRSTGNIGLGGGPANKPFSGVSNGPTVSPYLNLFREDFDGGSDFNYQTLVRPQLQQQQMNQDLQRQQVETNQRVQSLSARQAYTPQGSQSVMPTGHTATFRYHSHFYPTMGQNRRVK